MTERKQIRMTLSGENIEAFNAAKAKAERELGYTLRDNEFATRVLVHGVREKAE